MARRTGEFGPQIARRLRQSMEGAGLSVAELAEQSLVTRQTIYRIMEGQGGNSSVALMADLARALAVAPAWLAYGVGEAAVTASGAGKRRRAASG